MKKSQRLVALILAILIALSTASYIIYSLMG